MWDFNSVGEKDKWIDICGIKINLLEKKFIRVISEINGINWKVGVNEINERLNITTLLTTHIY